ncbi:interleukin-12 subunit beta [Salarias fasciatus]|uniref:Interleukin-12 subunit beta n=1 Tax=Salarias fasciatus TaxID=181472 RepID=A0A672HAA0_SALFA|nr:interleukin-12 subunit beta-like [Salarias fasciatus]
MRSLLLVLLCATCCSASQQDNIETLMDNIVIVHMNSNQGSKVRLTCGDAYQNVPVFWKRNGMELQQPLLGNQVEVLVEEMVGGNYSCHLSRNGEYLNHTVILIQLGPNNRTVILEETSPEEGHIHCSAFNYEGSFHCSWTRSQLRSRAPVLLVKAERFNETISCELDADGSGVRCQDANCSHNEEQHRIKLTLYIHSFSRLEVYTKSFYLRDIVKPEKLPNLRMSQGKVFSWDHPPSWSQPCTYFSLQYQVKVVRSGQECTSEEHIMTEDTDQTMHEVKVKTNRFVFCVRARDKYTTGQWSVWNQCTVNKDSVSC